MKFVFPAAPLLLMLSGAAMGANTTEAASAPAVSAAGSLLQVFIGLVAVLLLIAGTAWLAKRVGVNRVGASQVVQVISSASVGTRERVVVVEVGESWLVVGVAPGSVNALMTLPKGEIASSPAVRFDTGFSARLQQLIQQRREK